MIEFAPNDEIEELRPFVDEFWQLIFRTSYDTSFVSNESTLDSWEHYVGDREAVIKQVQWFYGVDISPYYDEPIPKVLRNIQQGLIGIKKDLESLPVRARASKDAIPDSDMQHLMRAHQLPLWPEYRDISIETVIVVVVTIIIAIAAAVIAAIYSIAMVYAFFAVIVAIALLHFSINAVINIANRPKRAHWRSQMGKVLSKRQIKMLTAENKQQWILLAVGKTPSSSSFGTYQNFGGGWDSITLLNTYTSEHYVVKGKLKEIERYAKKIGVPVI